MPRRQICKSYHPALHISKIFHFNLERQSSPYLNWLPPPPSLSSSKTLSMLLANFSFKHTHTHTHTHRLSLFCSKSNTGNRDRFQLQSCHPRSFVNLSFVQNDFTFISRLSAHLFIPLLTQQTFIQPRNLFRHHI